MFSRIVLRKIFPSTYQIAKTATHTSKLFSKNLISTHIASSTFNSNVVIRRLYSEQVTPEPMTVDYEHVKKATTDNNILIVDVREPDEIREHGKIPNSINIPLGNVTTILSTMPENEFERTYQRPKPKENTEIIFYCMIGKRSGKAQQNAINLGYKNVKNYLGSWTDWVTMVQK